MHVNQHYSSSTGNLYEIVAASGRRLLVDPGVPWTKIQKALDYDLTNIVAALAGHGHKDHFREPKKLMSAGIDIYASAETFESQGLLEHRRARIIANKTLVELGDFDIFAFGVQHDCEGALGFMVKEKATSEYLLYCTDTAYIRQRFGIAFSIIMLEVSYDKDVLQSRVDTNDINEELAKRLLTSHLSKQNAMKYLSEFCNLKKCRELHLLHLSNDNIDREKTREEFEDKFYIKTIVK